MTFVLNTSTSARSEFNIEEVQRTDRFLNAYAVSKTTTSLMVRKSNRVNELSTSPEQYALEDYFYSYPVIATEINAY